MNHLVLSVDSSEEIARAGSEVREAVNSTELAPNAVVPVFEAWAAALGEAETLHIPGVQFLRMWLRRGTLEPILDRELGRMVAGGRWIQDGRARLKSYPLGVIGHWPAGNIEIQPLLSMTCALLGGNGCLVRVPRGLETLTRQLLAKLDQIDSNGQLTSRIRMLVFDHSRRDLQEAMARTVDGAMIWGGEEAVMQIRSLPFPHWARLAVFGPRISVAAMDAHSWYDVRGRSSWCQRIARDVWQFDQMACSSPQVLFLERKANNSCQEFVHALEIAFETENRWHPRQTIFAGLTSAICQVRASWLMDNVTHRAVFPAGPDWTLLLGSGAGIPKPTQGKTLTVLEVDDLLEPVQKFDGNVQTLGLAIADPELERKLTAEAARKGVDRIVKLGRMHVFAPPWDGLDLVRPMVRMVRHVPSAELNSGGERTQW